MPRYVSALLLPLLTSLITAVATILVAYFQYVIPSTASRASKVAAETANAEVAAKLPQSIEVPISVDNPTKNESPRPLFVIGFCGAAHVEREIEGMIEPDTQSLRLISSALGAGRINFSILVPADWYYHVLETRGQAACQFRGWKI